MSDWGYYKPSRPRAAKGGIKSQSKRGDFAVNWWGKRWIEVLDSCGLGARLSRGRSYARNGQVLSIEIDLGQVRAAVQGSSPKPYTVQINIDTFDTGNWKRVIDAMAAEARFAAKLLAGEMPQDIETVFTAAGLSLFPARMSDISTRCSCPDDSNPCKHTAAVYCLLGEEFDRDPFLIFTLRGLTQEELRTALTGAGAGEPEARSLPPEPLTADPAVFWNGRALAPEPPDAVRRPPVSAPLLRRLGSFPFWRGDVPLLDALEPVYTAASEAGMELFLAESSVKEAHSA